MLQSTAITVKEYFKKHQELYMTLAVVLVVDHYLFDGALRDKVKAIIEKLLKREEKKLEVIDGAIATQEK